MLIFYVTTDFFKFVLGIASVASGMSSYIDTLVDGKIKITLADCMAINIPYLTSSPDFLALGIIVLITSK